MTVRRSFQFNTANAGIENDGIICSLFTDYHVRGTNYSEIAYAIDRTRPAGFPFDIVELGDRNGYKGTSKADLPIMVISGMHSRAERKTANYTVSVNDFVIIADTTAAAFTITMPLVSTMPKKFVYIKNVASNNLAIALTAPDLLDSMSSMNVTAFQSILLYADNTGAANRWYIMADK